MTARGRSAPRRPVARAPMAYHRPMRIRLAATGDAEAIRAIYNAEVTGGTDTFDLVPRTAAEQRAWLDRHQGAHPAVVAVADGRPGTAAAGRSLGLRVPLPLPEPARLRHHGGGLGLRRPGPPAARGRPGRARRADRAWPATHGFHTVIARIVGQQRGLDRPPPGLRLRAGRASSGRSAASTAGGSTWSSSSGCSERRPGAAGPSVRLRRPADGRGPSQAVGVAGRRHERGPAAERRPAARPAGPPGPPPPPAGWRG